MLKKRKWHWYGNARCE